MCHAILTDIKFLKQLVQIDQDLADQARFQGCGCGGALHQAHFPRKPRSCPSAVRDDFAKRFSFCCAQCRRRVTAVSVRFLGRRVHLALAVLLLSERGPTPAATNRLARQLAISARTIARWRQWWRDSFPVTALWQTMCGRFVPPLDMTLLPDVLLARFTGDAREAIKRLLVFLTPLTDSAAITLHAGR